MNDRELTKSGAELIRLERQRQINAEGWTAEHDDHHDRHELAWAAACYVAPETIYRIRLDPLRGVSWTEPWPQEFVANLSRGESGHRDWKRAPADRITQLARAGALIAAEIDRLQRAASSAASTRTPTP